MPEHSIQITAELMQEISEITVPHIKALNDDIAERFPHAPDMYFTFALGFAISTLLASLGDDRARASAAQRMTMLTNSTGYALVPNSSKRFR